MTGHTPDVTDYERFADASHGRRQGAVLLAALGVSLAIVATVAAGDDLAGLDGSELYDRACSACHGAGGRGASAALVGFDVPLPDFTDCTFASREPTADWVIVAHEGGPVRGFSELMPAFGDILTDEQLDRVVGYVKDMCSDRSWPPGEFNLPRALATGKAYPEDEVMMQVEVTGEGDGSVDSKIIYEKRFGARNQWEVVFPFGWSEMADGSGRTGWTSGLGDVAFALKRAIHHDLERGSIVAVTGEVVMPTGDEDRGYGSGTFELEPFLTYGQILPAGFFFQSQLGYKAPVDRDLSDEAFLRLNLGRSFTQGPFGRTISPMVDVAGSRDLDADDATTLWAAIPQVQITLNTRQHIMMNLGVRLPINERDGRDTSVIVYLLWDWFDGGFLEGW